MERAITTSEPSVFVQGLSDCRTFNIGIKPIEDSEFGEPQWECYPKSAIHATLCDIVPPFVAAGFVFTPEEQAAIGQHCEPSTYGDLVSAIIDAKYPRQEMDAVRNNYDRVRDGKAGDKAEIYTEEYEAMQDWRDYAKAVAKSFISS